ncbi:MAG: HD domain-containing phosphohydrolase [Pseudomonadota bacterium]
MAVCGDGRDYVEALHLSWGDVPRGHGPSGTAVRSGQMQVIRDIANDSHFAPWREAALKHGYASSIALPLRENGIVFGVLSVYAAEPDAFDAEEVALLEEFADDLAFGVVSMRARNERDQAVKERELYEERLRDSMEDALQAISATLEMRDPYTAGHQRRVSQLAAAMARELELPEEQVHGVRLAGIVHDIGKIHVPAEILSKPGHLNEVEFSFIKMHPQSGYDILKGIDFPWPIAQIVLQHHERLDGSGYPQGLKGDDILPEARILAVADVVEAMASHRPYRAGLGVQSALEEIIKYRGVRYDERAVDACLRLFRDRNYVLTS